MGEERDGSEHIWRKECMKKKKDTIGIRKGMVQQSSNKTIIVSFVY